MLYLSLLVFERRNIGVQLLIYETLFEQQTVEQIVLIIIYLEYIQAYTQQILLLVVLQQSRLIYYDVPAN
jgi:hypothetical protein